MRSPGRVGLYVHCEVTNSCCILAIVTCFWDAQNAAMKLQGGTSEGFVFGYRLASLNRSVPHDANAHLRRRSREPDSDRQRRAHGCRAVMRDTIGANTHKLAGITVAPQGGLDRISETAEGDRAVA